MGETSTIQWTNATWNPITGCSIDSLGCNNCYAAELAGTRLKNHWSRKGLTKCAANGVYVFNGKVRFNEEWLDQPLRWQKPRMIFVCAHGDLFHESVPDEWIDRVFAVMALTPQHTFQVLTKRAQRMRDWFAKHDRAHDHNTADRVADAAATLSGRKGAKGAVRYANSSPGWPLPNVWLGVSAEDQERADERIPLLLETPATVRWVSAEPLLGPIDLTDLCDGVAWRDVPEEYWIDEYDTDDSPPALRWDALQGQKLQRWGDYAEETPALDWVVIGGESGRRARPCNVDWVRFISNQCEENHVPCFVKQFGSRPVKHGLPLGLSDRKGGDIAEWPTDLRIRQWPKALS